MNTVIRVEAPERDDTSARSGTAIMGIFTKFLRTLGILAERLEVGSAKAKPSRLLWPGPRQTFKKLAEICYRSG
jgi:hypothetical protein